MKTIALISGGKDSLLSVLVAKRYGHEPVVLANITPAQADTHEIDSYMYQTVGHEVIEAMASCMELPLRRSQVDKGHSKDQTLLYTETRDPQDEVETLYRLLKSIKDEFPEVQGVTTGAILSNYQRNRVESVCHRLQLTSLAYLWQRQADEILDMVEAFHMEAILVKTASIGLDPRNHVGKTLSQMRATLEKLDGLYGSHMAGEGGEFETIVLDCPLFVAQRLVVRSLDVVVVDDNEYAPSGHAVLQVDCCAKSAAERAADTVVLSALLRGEPRFPSDAMAALPQAAVPATPRLAAWTVLDDQASVVTSLQSGVFGVDGRVHTLTTPVDAAHPDPPVVIAALLAQVSSHDVSGETGAAAWSIAKCTLLLPQRMSACAAKAAYASLAPAAAPALCDVFSLANLDEARLVVEVVPRNAVSETDVLHSESISCWAAGVRGPFALARRLVTPAGDRLVATAATPGRTAVDWQLATPPLLSAEDRDVLAALGSEEAASAAQFAYAFANAVAYGETLGCTLAHLHGVTVYTVRADVVSMLPRLWSWCADGKVAEDIPLTAVVVADMGTESPGTHLSLSMQWSKACV